MANYNMAGGEEDKHTKKNYYNCGNHYLFYLFIYLWTGLESNSAIQVIVINKFE